LRGEDVAWFARLWEFDPDELLRPMIDLSARGDVLAN
jgi:hypothetical protein